MLRCSCSNRRQRFDRGGDKSLSLLCDQSSPWRNSTHVTPRCEYDGLYDHFNAQVEIYTGSTRRMSPQSADTSNKGFARIIRGISDFQVQNSAFQNASPEPCFLIMRNNIKQWMKLGSSSLWAHTYASIDFRLPSSLTSWFSSSRSFHWKQLPRPHLWFRSIYEQFHIERLIKVKSLGYRIWNRIDKLAGGLARRISPFGSSSGSTVRNCSEIANWYRSHGSGKVLPKPSIQELLFSWSMFVYRLIV